MTQESTGECYSTPLTDDLNRTIDSNKVKGIFLEHTNIWAETTKIQRPYHALNCQQTVLHLIHSKK